MRSVDHDGFDDAVVLLCEVVSQMAARLRQQGEELKQAQVLGQKYYEKWTEQESLRGYCKRCYKGLDTE